LPALSPLRQVLEQAQSSYDAGLAELVGAQRVPADRIEMTKRLAEAKLDQIKRQAVWRQTSVVLLFWLTRSAFVRKSR
jgi:hypothetical protein